jgi:hypothetical protein
MLPAELEAFESLGSYALPEYPFLVGCFAA